VDGQVGAHGQEVDFHIGRRELEFFRPPGTEETSERPLPWEEVDQGVQLGYTEGVSSVATVSEAESVESSEVGLDCSPVSTEESVEADDSPMRVP
jgi:hypothetical protein